MDGYVMEIRRESNVKVVNRWIDTSGDKEGKQC